MIYSENQIVMTCASSGVALVAEKDPTEWANHHVFLRMDVDNFVGDVNIGRLPIVEVRQVNTEYEFQAEPDHFGSRTSQWIIRIICPTALNRQSNKSQKLQALKTAILYHLTSNLNLGVTNVSVQSPQITQHAVFIDIQLTTETSYDKNYEEGT